MDTWVWLLIGGFVVVDAVVTVVVLRSLRRRRERKDPHADLSEQIGLE